MKDADMAKGKAPPTPRGIFGEPQTFEQENNSEFGDEIAIPEQKVDLTKLRQMSISRMSAKATSVVTAMTTK